jgi:hypothetical protein
MVKILYNSTNYCNFKNYVFLRTLSKDDDACLMLDHM